MCIASKDTITYGAIVYSGLSVTGQGKCETYTGYISGRQFDVSIHSLLSLHLSITPSYYTGNPPVPIHRSACLDLLHTDSVHQRDILVKLRARLVDGKHMGDGQPKAMCIGELSARHHNQ